METNDFKADARRKELKEDTGVEFPHLDVLIGKDGNKRFQGRVCWWGEEEGYGFITLSGSEDVFIHHSQIVDNAGLMEGETVEFSLDLHEERPVATNLVRKKRELTTRTYRCDECGASMSLTEIVIGDQWE